MRDTRLVADPIPIPAAGPAGAVPPRLGLVDIGELKRLAELAGEHVYLLLDDAGRKEVLRSAHGLAEGLAELERAACGERP